MSDRSYKYESHGTAVSSVVVGGFDFSLVNLNTLRHTTKLRIRNAVERKSRSYDDYYIDTVKLADYLNEADRDGLITNLSVTYSEKVEAIERVENSGRTLIIVAAGNNGGRLEAQHKAWPAMSGGKDNSTIITVGALETDGRRAPFSNWSNEHVDIGALGCDVRVWTYDQKIEKYKLAQVSGTSFAAPQVTSVAAWLRRIYPNFTALSLKHHLISSADLEINLDTDIRHGRILNAAKALRSIYADVVEVQSPTHPSTLHTGRIRYPGDSPSIRIGDQHYPRRNILKFSQLGTSNRIIYLRRDDNKMAEPILTKATLNVEEIDFEDAVSGESYKIKVSDIKDIVFAYKPYWLSN
jgi:subtilisin family serine protease